MVSDGAAGQVTTGRRLCRLDDIPDGLARGFSLAATGEVTVFVVRRGDQVFAYRDACPHEGTPLAWCRDEYLSPDHERIVCSGHGAEFEIASGLCVQGPCVGEHLVSVPVRIDCDGDVVLVT